MKPCDEMEKVPSGEPGSGINDHEKNFFEIQTFLAANGQHYSAMSSLQQKKLREAVEYFRRMADERKTDPHRGR